MRWGYNVVLTFVFRICDGIATGVWASSVLSNYISVQQGTERGTEMVGIAQAVQGTFLVAAAIPGAWLASHFRRDLILKVMGLVAFAAIACTTSSLLYYEGDGQYIRLCISLALWGVAQANAPVLDALFADSVSTGGRTALYTRLHICYILSQGLGPAVAALVFYIQGDEWSTERLRMVMLCGMGLAVIPAVLLLLFDDDQALGEESEGLLKVLARGERRSPRASASDSGGDDTQHRQPLLAPGEGESDDDDLGREGREGARPWDEEVGWSTYVTDDEHDLEGFDDILSHSPTGGDNHFSTSLSPISGSSMHTVTTIAPGTGVHGYRLNASSDVVGTSDSVSVDVHPDVLISAHQMHGRAGHPAPHMPFGPSPGLHPQLIDPDQEEARVIDPDSHAIDLSEGAATHYSSEIASVTSAPAAPHVSMPAFRQPPMMGSRLGAAAGDLAGGTASGADITTGPTLLRRKSSGEAHPGPSLLMPTLDEEGTDASTITVPLYSEMRNSEALPGRISSLGPAGHSLRAGSLVAASASSLGDWLSHTRSGGMLESHPSSSSATAPQQPNSPKQPGGVPLSRAYHSAHPPGRLAISSGLDSSVGSQGDVHVPNQDTTTHHDVDSSDVLLFGTSSEAVGIVPAMIDRGDSGGGGNDDSSFEPDSGKISSITFGTLQSSMPGSLPYNGGGVQGSGASINLAMAMGAGPRKPLPGGAIVTSTGVLKPTPYPHTLAPPPPPPSGVDLGSPVLRPSITIHCSTHSPSIFTPRPLLPPPPPSPAHDSIATISSGPTPLRLSDSATQPPSSLLTDALAALSINSPSGNLPTVRLSPVFPGGDVDGARIPLLERHLMAAAAAAEAGGYEEEDGLVGLAGISVAGPEFLGFSTLHDSSVMDSPVGMRTESPDVEGGGWGRGRGQHLVHQGRVLSLIPWGEGHADAGREGDEGGMAAHPHLGRDVPSLPPPPPPPPQQQGVLGGGGSRRASGSPDQIVRRMSRNGTTSASVNETVRRIQSRDVVGFKRIASVQQLHEAHRFGCLDMNAIPGIVALTDCVMGLASGMTIKFFPIFFRQAVGLTPVYVNLMYCAVPLCLSCAAALAQKESTIIGRVQTMIVNRAIGILLLYWMAYYIDLWGFPNIMVPVYILRTSIMNANYPIQRALLMDYVPKEHRAKWNSLESVTSFGWSGSAAVGGWLINTYGFQLTFFITATMQFVGWLCSILLLPIVPWHDLTPQMFTVSQPGSASRSVRSWKSTGGTSGGGGGGGGSIRRRARRLARAK